VAKIMDISDYPAEEPDVSSMDAEQLKACLRQLRERMAELDDHEPEDMNSEAYAEWGQLHEDLEDLADEIADRLDELE